MTDAEVIARLEKLERENRRLKRSGLIALAALAGLVAIAPTRPVPQNIKAHEFDLVDSRGTVRAALRMEPLLPRYIRKAFPPVAPGLKVQRSPELYMKGTFTENGQAGILDALLSTRGLSVVAVGAGHFKTTSLTQGALQLTGYTPTISLVGAPLPQGAISMRISKDGAPDLEINDAKGYTMDLGSTATVMPATGETQHTSAASIIMFGNDKQHHVIWKAP